MSFGAIARALEEAHAAGRARNLRLQVEIVRDLFARPQAKREKEGVEQLLRVLLPGEDRERVYGFKIRGLLHAFAHALSKGGRPDLAARLHGWVPTPCRSLLTAHEAIVCLPELELALLAERFGAGGSSSSLPASLADVCAVCDAMSQGLASEHLLQLLQTRALTDGPSWTLFLRMLLRGVSVGVGRATVFAALPHPAAAAFYARQRSLSALAHAVATGDERVGVVCGTPFVPMTGDALRAPYLLPWIFSREEQLRSPIPPIDGRLVIVMDRRSDPPQERWYAPLNSHFKTRMVNIEEERVLDKAYRRRHMLVLRGLKQARLLEGANAEGLVLHYTLSLEEHGLIVCLLRAASDALENGVELAGDGAKEELTLPMSGGSAAFRTMERIDFLRTLIRHASAHDANASETVFKTLGRVR
jgi:hypothetical protein